MWIKFNLTHLIHELDVFEPDWKWIDPQSTKSNLY